MSMNAALVRATYPQAHARARHRLQRAGAVARRRRPARRVAAPILQRRVLAVAVRDQRAARPRGLRASACAPCRTTPGTARAVRLRSRRRSAPSRSASLIFGAETLRARRAGHRALAAGHRRGRGRAAGAPRLHAPRAAAAARPAAHSDLRACRSRTSIISFAAQMLALVALPFLLAGRAGPQRGGDRPADDAVAARGGGRRTAGRTACRPLSGRAAWRHRARRVRARTAVAVAARPQHPDTFDIALAHGALRRWASASSSRRTTAPWSTRRPATHSGAAGGMLATARLLGQTAGAVSVAAGFHWLGVGSGPMLLRCAAVAAVLAAVISMLRLRLAR